MLRRALYFVLLVAATRPVLAQETGVQNQWQGQYAYYDLADALRDPASVTSLHLGRQGLTSVPAEIARFTNLVELDLSGNEISDIGDALGSLSKLEKLDLSNNRLTAIPSGLCGLSKLKTLNLSSNKITSGSVGCLSSLQWIYLNNNSLTAIPEGLTGIATLRGVFLQANQITTLPEEFARLANLEALLVQYNKIAVEPNAYKHTGIVNYVFEPQLISTRHLYKYLESQPDLNVTVTLDFSGERVSSRLQKKKLSSGIKVPKEEKWARMASYLAYYGGAGLGPSHRYFRSRGVEASPAVQTDLRTEYGKNNLGFGVYFSITPWEYTVDDIFVNTATLGKAGVYFKYYVLKLSSRLRPYARVGAGINIEGDIPEKYQRRFNFQVRAGADYYLLRFFGFHAETGFGAGNIVSLGVVYRIPFSARG